MGSIINYNEESIKSSNEVGDEDLGVGRSYECVFCKRGFNTAQALGGHMNIHRKDRSAATNKPKYSIKDDHVYTPPRPSSTNNHHRFSSQDHQPLIYFPASSTAYHHHHQENLDRDHPLNIRLSLGFPPSKEKDLDLELRLGYH